MAENEEDGFSGPWWQYPVLRNALLSGLVTGATFLLLHRGIIPEGAGITLYSLAILLGGYHWGREGVERLTVDHEVGIEALMLGATIGSAVLGMWEEAATLVFLYGAAEGVEEYTHNRARRAIRALLDLAPREARLLNGTTEVVVPAEKLQVGDVFVVRPGESIPTDGVIQAGSSSLDESPVTGESIPAEKGPGMKVFAASINRFGAITVSATATFADNTLSKIIHLVEEAQEQKGRTQQWIERFGRIYSPAVLLTALSFVFVPWLFGVGGEDWYRRAVVLLVAAAPCALIMSMPVAMAAGIGAAGKRGILVKGGVHLEHLGTIRVVAFDKTGTLTCGKPSVTDVVPNEFAEVKLLSVASSLERFSEHPLAAAVREKALAMEAEPAEVHNFQALAGAGATALIDGEAWYIGSPDLFATIGAPITKVLDVVAQLQTEGKTVVVVGTSNVIAGLIAIQDQIRDGAIELVRDLHSAGLRTAMLTGDNERTATSIGQRIGVLEIQGNLKPEAKVAAIQRLEKQWGAVLMIGDGVNDAPALAAATCGIAMGAAGSDAAIEAADVALMADDLRKVKEALRLGTVTRRISTQNIVFSILLLVVMIPLAVAGVLSVAIAVLVHELGELLAVANGLRVRKAVSE